MDSAGIQHTEECMMEHGNSNPGQPDRDQCLTLVMAFVIKHQLSGVALKDLIELFNVLLPGMLPESKYYIDKEFFQMSSPCANFLCLKCKEYMGMEPPDVCHSCSAVFSRDKALKEGSYFISVSIKEQLKAMFEVQNLTDALNQNRFCGRDEISDLQDGMNYKEHQSFLHNPDNLSFTWNTDGVPVFQSSNFSIWPLLMTINEVKPGLRSKFVLLQGLYFGNKKPTMNSYLKPFVDEMVELFNTGLAWTDSEGVEHITRCIAPLACVDSPARALLQNIKQFNGQFGCSFCEHPGVVAKKGQGFTRVYPLEYPLPSLRSSDSIQHQGVTAEETRQAVRGVKGLSILQHLPCFDLALSFSPDYMHSVLLGVVRQILNLLFDSVNHKETFYLGPRKQAILDSQLITLCPPSDITRSPRSLSQRAQWKANEYRSFLLYYSPLLFENVMESRYYLHWLLLVNAIHILVSREITEKELSNAKLYLFKFVRQMEQLYGHRHVSFNIHLLTHLSDSVSAWGPLWATSAFVFEDTNRKLMNMFHGTQGVPKQIVKHFLGYRCLDQKAEACLEYASSLVKETYNKLTSRSSDIQHATRCPGAVVLLGTPHEHFLNPYECVEIDKVAGREVINRKVLHFRRFLSKSVRYSTNEYAQQHKRCDSCFQVNGRLLLIEKCVRGKLFCQCVRECTCQWELFIICTLLKPIAFQGIYHDCYTDTNLSGRWIIVQNAGLTAINSHDVHSMRKMVFLESGSNKVVFPFHKFESD